MTGDQLFQVKIDGVTYREVVAIKDTSPNRYAVYNSDGKDISGLRVTDPRSNPIQINFKGMEVIVEEASRVQNERSDGPLIMFEQELSASTDYCEYIDGLLRRLKDDGILGETGQLKDYNGFVMTRAFRLPPRGEPSEKTRNLGQRVVSFDLCKYKLVAKPITYPTPIFLPPISITNRIFTRP